MGGGDITEPSLLQKILHMGLVLAVMVTELSIVALPQMHDLIPLRGQKALSLLFVIWPYDSMSWPNLIGY